MKRTLLILLTLLALVTGALAQNERSYDNSTLIVRYDGGDLSQNLMLLQEELDFQFGPSDGVYPLGYAVFVESDPFYDEMFGYRLLHIRIFDPVTGDELVIPWDDFAVLDAMWDYFTNGAGVDQIVPGGVFHNELGTFEQFPVNDPLFVDGRQGFLNRGNFPAAWASNSTGTPNIRIAVGDTGWENGVFFNPSTGATNPHEDLQAKIAGGINFTGFGGILNTADIDPRSHGTRVAGLAGADTNNGLGVAGTGYNTNLVVFKAGNFSNAIGNFGPAGVTYWGILATIFFAHNFFDCQIINISGTLNISGAPFILQLLADAVVKNATNGNLPGGSGFPPSLIVAASGNVAPTSLAANILFFPANHPNVMAVGGTDNVGGKAANGTLLESFATYSRLGGKVEVAAAAQGLYSTENYNFIAQLLVPLAYVGDGSGYTVWPSAGFGGGGFFGQGTSFAAPQVAGLAGLVWDFAANSSTPALNLNPFNVASYVRARIRKNTDIIRPSTANFNWPNGRTIAVNSGRINAGRSVAYVDSVLLPSLSVASAKLGTSFTARIVLDRPARPGGELVRISSSNPGLARPFLTTIRVAAGQTTGTVGITIARQFNVPFPEQNRQKVEIYADLRDTRQVGQLFVVK